MSFCPIDNRIKLSYNTVEVIHLKKNWLLVIIVVLVFFAAVLFTLGALLPSPNPSSTFPQLFALAYSPTPPHTLTP